LGTHHLPRIARRPDPGIVEMLIAVALMLDLILEAALAPGVPHRAVTAVFAVALAAPIAVRRRWPAAAVIGCTAALLLEDPWKGQLLNLPGSMAVIPLLLCSYSAGAWLETRRSVAAISTAAALLTADSLIEIYGTGVNGGGPSTLATLMVLFMAPWVVGRVVHARARRADAFTAMAARAAAERTERERAAVAEERLTIGRELQDIIAHSVSVMVVQAGGARRVLHDQPDRARESILSVEQTGREVLAEMRRMLGLLRRDEDPRALTPQPGLDQLPELAATLADAGLSCELRTEGDPIELTPGVDLVSYRVIEATLERAAATQCRHATATIGYRSRQLELEIRGDRRMKITGDDLTAVSERVQLYGGKLVLLDSEATGFAIRCLLPLDGAVTA
jgi:signal transduction histidine kinase